MTTGQTTVSVTVDSAAMNHLLHSETGPVGQWMTRVVNRSVNLAKPNTPVRTGYLRSRVNGRVTPGPEGLTGELVASTGYARYVENGTRYMKGRHMLRDAAFQALRETT